MKTASTLQHFVLKDSKIYWIANMPEEPVPYGVGDEQYYGARMDEYKSALQSAIDSAVEVSNQEELADELPFPLEPGKVYTFECSVEKKQYEEPWTHTVALVTFPQPEAKEPIWMRCDADCQGQCNHPSHCHTIKKHPEDNNKEAERFIKSKYPDANFEDKTGIINGNFWKGLSLMMTEYYTLRSESDRKEIERLKNELLDALDLKQGNGPTALSMLKSELDRVKEQNGKAESDKPETEDQDIENVYHKAIEIAESDYYHLKHFREWINKRYTIIRK